MPVVLMYILTTSKFAGARYDFLKFPQASMLTQALQKVDQFTDLGLFDMRCQAERERVRHHILISSLIEQLNFQTVHTDQNILLIIHDHQVYLALVLADCCTKV
jgi:hypothetical protein